MKPGKGTKRTKRTKITKGNNNKITYTAPKATRSNAGKKSKKGSKKKSSPWKIGDTIISPGAVYTIVADGDSNGPYKVTGTWLMAGPGGRYTDTIGKDLEHDPQGIGTGWRKDNAKNKK